jgi:hypothetical protein
MDIAQRSDFESPRPDETDYPAMWKVLVSRIEMAERRQRISDDWERFAFGTAARRPCLMSSRH